MDLKMKSKVRKLLDEVWEPEISSKNLHIEVLKKLTIMAVTLMEKRRMLWEKQQVNEETSELEVNLLDLPTELLEQIASFVSQKHLKNFGLANKKCQQIFQLIDHKSLDLKKCFKMDEKKILEKAKTRNYISLNLKGCYWLSSKTVLELISKEAVRELDLIDCECAPEVIEAIAKLNLSSVSIFLTKNWQDFFVSNESNSVLFLKKLKKLTIYHQNASFAKMLLTFVPRHILQHCSNLKYLKLFTFLFNLKTTRSSDYESFQALNVPTPVPKLESLILDFPVNNGIFQDIKNLLELILNKKEIPLKWVDLNKFTANAILDGMFLGKNISFEKSRSCCLSCIYDIESDGYIELSDLLSADGCESLVDSMLKSPFCKAISIKNVFLNELLKLSAKIINSGNTSIEQISLNGCFVYENVCVFIKDICNLNSGITFLDMTCLARNWESKNNSNFINSIANLRNLRTLHLAPFFMSTNTKLEKFWLKLSLRKMARQCETFKNLHIVDYYRLETIVSQEILLCVRHFKNLRELYLAYFRTSGDTASLPAITKNCAKLENLVIESVHMATEPRCDDGQMIEESLAHAKQLKHLSVNQSFEMTKQFVDNLSECTKIEHLLVKPISKKDMEVNMYFAHSLKNLPKLEMFITRARPEVLRLFKSAIDQILTKGRKPVFVGRQEENLL